MKTIRENTKNQLESLGIPIYDTRVNPSQLSSLPICVIYSKNLSITNELPHALGVSGVNEYSFVIDIVVAYTNGHADILDDYINQVINLLSDPLYIATNFDNIATISVDYSYVVELEKPLAIGSITINANITR